MQHSQALVGMQAACAHIRPKPLLTCVLCPQVDVDLMLAGCAKRVSRQQATLSLRPDGKFSLRNIGRRSFFVNSRQVGIHSLLHVWYLAGKSDSVA